MAEHPVQPPPSGPPAPGGPPSGLELGLRLRSLVFNLFLFASMTVVMTTYLPLLLLPPVILRRALRAWVRLVDRALRLIIGLDWRVEGLEHMPPGGAIVACKHQSTWETFFFFLLFPDVAYVVKKELSSIPFWGWFALHSGAVVVDREGGGRALKRMVRESQALVGAGRPLIVFPEGTRTPPGERRPFFPGIAAIASRVEAPVVPVALNSGLFWGRRAFLKRPGTITVRFLAPLPPGLAKAEFLAQLQDRIDTASAELLRLG